MSSLNVRIALEAALDAMPPIIAASTISTSSAANPTIITTAAPHLLTTGLYVTIAGHTSTPSINGVWPITVTAANKFTIPVAVTVAGTGGTATAILSPKENVNMNPITGVPWQAYSLQFAQPDNPEMGASYFSQGFIQVDLSYPKGVGVGACATRAELIASTFKRGNTYTHGGTVVSITKTAYIMAGYPTVSEWVIPVRINFRAQVPV